MVWASIWIGGCSYLVIIERDPPSRRNGFTTNSYIAALDQALVPNYEPGTIFQQDNASIHKSDAAKKWFEYHGIHIAHWPARSSDLNLIEPVWWPLKCALRNRHPELRGVLMGQSEVAWVYFERCIYSCWWSIPQEKIDGLIISMQWRLLAVRKAKPYLSIIPNISTIYHVLFVSGYIGCIYIYIYV